MPSALDIIRQLCRLNMAMGYMFLGLLLSLVFMVASSLLLVDASSYDNMESRLTKLEVLMERVDARFAQTHDTFTKLISALIQKEVSVVQRQVLESTDDVETIISQISIEDLRELLRGRDGRDGQDGEDGADGVDGANGQPGYQGPPGLNGRDGRDGDSGSPGQPGADGNPGADGIPGLNSTIGLKGEPGNLGSQGLPGPKGAVGSPGSSGAPAENLQGSVYTRWGRKTCPVGSTIVYEGLAAAHAHNLGGGGTNFQCLPLSPQYNAYSSSGGSIIAGTEYETRGNINSAADDQNVPCARCYSPRSVVMMTPARRDCPANWTKEYEGYLMSEASSSSRNPTTYECVDEHPEYVFGQGGNTNGASFYYVYPDCHSDGTVGHCPPYNAGKQLTCVVCTR